MTSPRALLTVTAGLDVGRRVALAAGQRVVLGRGQDAELPVVDDRASRHHAAVEARPDGVWVTDLASRNGTLLDGRPLAPDVPARVIGRATIAIGAHAIEVALAPTAVAPEPAPPSGGWPPGVLEAFEVGRALGRGAAGAVYAARHRASGRAVALKVLVSAGLDAQARARFAREAEVRVRHPRVVEVLDLRVEGPHAWLVLELVVGSSLDAHLRAGPLPIPAAVRIGADVAEGLAAAHALGVVHRDVKPANVLVDATGRAKVSDFGIARVRDSLLTATGTGLGTLDYMAPEQAEDAKRAGPPSDLYGLGATLFHALAGRPPIDLRGGDPFGPLLTTVPPALVRVRPGCPAALSLLVAGLLEKHPDDRPASAADVARRLAALS